MEELLNKMCSCTGIYCVWPENISFLLDEKEKKMKGNLKISISFQKYYIPYYLLRRLGDNIDYLNRVNNIYYSLPSDHSKDFSIASRPLSSKADIYDSDPCVLALLER